MRMKSIRHILLAALLLAREASTAQSVSDHLPKKISKSEKYLFYLHGGVVTVLGNNAINQSMPEWGPYEYLNILDSLRSRGFNVISERRREEIQDSVYVVKITKQIDTLLNAEVRPDSILLVGASAGWNIGIHVSDRIKNKNLKYVIMGGCWPNTHEEFSDIELYGHFLSIIEATDPHGTCYKIFENRKNLSSSNEIKLNTGMSHGFFYKGYKHWIDPIIGWFYR
jgi:hypothetical protein